MLLKDVGFADLLFIVFTVQSVPVADLKENDPVTVLVPTENLDDLCGSE
jgi:hypothetical protein